MRLLLYLKAALSMEKDAQPAGAFYMRVADPLLPDKADTALVEDALARELCLRGVALKDAAILRRMDEGDPPLTLPKMINADGEFAKSAMLATLSDLERLIYHARETAEQLAEKMQSGHIAASPLCDKNLKGPCDYCDYAAICRMDLKRLPDKARPLGDMSFDQLLESVNKKRTGNSEPNHV